jgi:hypothetical protein
MAFDPTKPVQTHGGRKARILCTDRNSTYNIVALIEEFQIESFDKDGKWVGGSDEKYCLINIPERKTSWLNLYITASHPSRSVADLVCRGGEQRKGVLEIIWEDGVPVDTKVHPV